MIELLIFFFFLDWMLSGFCSAKWDNKFEGATSNSKGSGLGRFTMPFPLSGFIVNDMPRIVSFVEAFLVKEMSGVIIFLSDIPPPR